MSEQMKDTLKIPEDLIADMNRHLPEAMTIERIQELRRDKLFRVMFVLNDALMNTDVEDMLDLSRRSSNSLKRAGYKTIGDMLEKLDSFDELDRIRNCGAKSKAEIKGKLFFYQYSLIPHEKRTAYMKKIMELNGIE